MLTYSEIEDIHRTASPFSAEYQATRAFVEYHRLYLRGLTDPIYGLHKLDELRTTTERALEQKQSITSHLISLQQRIRTLREDYHDDAGLDERLNGIEAEVGAMIEKARGE